MYFLNDVTLVPNVNIIILILSFDFSPGRMIFRLYVVFTLQYKMFTLRCFTLIYLVELESS